MSDDVYRLTYAVDPVALRRAMVATGQRLAKVQSRGVKLRNIGWFVVLGLVFSTANIALKGLYDIELLNAGFLAGIVVMLLTLVILHRGNVTAIAEHATEAAMRQGPVTLTVGPEGLLEESAIGRLEVVWEAVDQIAPQPDATTISFGGLCMSVPDSALPNGTSPEDFRAQLDGWRAAEDVFG